MTRLPLIIGYREQKGTIGERKILSGPRVIPSGATRGRQKPRRRQPLPQRPRRPSPPPPPPPASGGGRPKPAPREPLPRLLLSPSASLPFLPSLPFAGVRWGSGVSPARSEALTSGSVVLGHGSGRPRAGGRLTPPGLGCHQRWWWAAGAPCCAPWGAPPPRVPAPSSVAAPRSPCAWWWHAGLRRVWHPVLLSSALVWGAVGGLPRCCCTVRRRLSRHASRVLLAGSAPHRGATSGVSLRSFTVRRRPALASCWPGQAAGSTCR
jgi:hypothetical protein